jgi:hypothetical protein
MICSVHSPTQILLIFHDKLNRRFWGNLNFEGNWLAVEGNKGGAIWLVSISHEMNEYQFHNDFD